MIVARRVTSFYPKSVAIDSSLPSGNPNSVLTTSVCAAPRPWPSLSSRSAHSLRPLVAQRGVPPHHLHLISSALNQSGQRLETVLSIRCSGKRHSPRRPVVARNPRILARSSHSLAACQTTRRQWSSLTNLAATWHIKPTSTPRSITSTVSNQPPNHPIDLYFSSANKEITIQVLSHHDTTTNPCRSG